MKSVPGGCSSIQNAAEKFAESNITTGISPTWPSLAIPSSLGLVPRFRSTFLLYVSLEADFTSIVCLFEIYVV